MAQEISPTWQRFISIVKDHARTISIVALIFVIFVGGYLWNRRHKAVRRHRAAVELRDGINLFYASRQAENPDFRVASASLSNVIEAYSGTDAASQAALYLGHIYYAQGNYTAALDKYREAASEFGSDSPFKEVALFNVAYTLEAKRDFGNARKAYEQVLGLLRGVLKDRAVMGIGRCWEAQGDLKTAAETYQSMLRRFPNSPWAPELRQRLDMLRVKRVNAQ
jgi:TolA-binding protein